MALIYESKRITLLTTSHLGCHVTKTAFHISLCHIKGLFLFVFSQFTHNTWHYSSNSVGYFDLYFVLFITIKYDMKTGQKIVNNSIKQIDCH